MLREAINVSLSTAGGSSNVRLSADNAAAAIVVVLVFRSRLKLDHQRTVRNGKRHMDHSHFLVVDFQSEFTHNLNNAARLVRSMYFMLRVRTEK